MRLRNLIRGLLVLVLAAGGLAAPAAGASFPEPVEGDFVLRDFRFGTGETLPELKLHYRTLGRPVRDDRGRTTNAVLVLHGTGGSGSNFLSETFAGQLFGPGRLLDAARYFIVLPDGIGHGQSNRARCADPHQRGDARPRHPFAAGGVGLPFGGLLESAGAGGSLSSRNR